MNKYLLIFLMLCGTNAYAEIHRWVDDHGKVHYTDQPPVGVDATELRSAPAPGSAPAAAKTFAEREADLKKAQQTKKEADARAAQKQANAEAEKYNCSVAQQALLSLKSGRRVAEYDANGERSFLGESELQQRTAKAQEEVAKWCK
ncbi:MAG TPA: DUF4124 domain-containing protein [Gallionella sp.]|nr:DUF4124 domain-containing protein [Gallionella sp.]